MQKRSRKNNSTIDRRHRQSPEFERGKDNERETTDDQQLYVTALSYRRYTDDDKELLDVNNGLFVKRIVFNVANPEENSNFCSDWQGRHRHLADIFQFVGRSRYLRVIEIRLRYGEYSSVELGIANATCQVFFLNPLVETKEKAVNVLVGIEKVILSEICNLLYVISSVTDLTIQEGDDDN